MGALSNADELLWKDVFVIQYKDTNNVSYSAQSAALAVNEFYKFFESK